MATPSLSPSSVTVPNGGTANVAVSWTLDPGTPDVSGTLSLVIDGQTISGIPVVKQGRPAEQAPRLVTASPLPGDVLVSCDAATVALVDQGTIRLS
jgi:hypothetical protein